jgi:dynein heavy chain
VIELDQMSLKRMLDITKQSVGLKTLPDKNREDALASLEKEANVDFQRSMNKIIFDKIVVESGPVLGFVTLPDQKPPRTPQKGCVTDLPAYDFDAQYYNFSFVSLLTRKEAIDALSKVKVECNRVAAMSMFQIPNKHMKLDEFEQTQTQQTSQVGFFAGF